MSEQETYPVPPGTVVEPMQKVLEREVLSPAKFEELRKAARKRDKKGPKDARGS